MTGLNNSAISFRNLHFRYLETGPATLDDLTLEIPAGQVIAILGPNGAGKTTLLHLLLGYLKPEAGEILIKGNPIKSYHRSQMGKLVGLIPQKETHLLNFSVLDYVLLGRAPYLAPLQMPTRVDVEIAHQALVRLGISDLQDRPLPELSGGEQQIVLAARTLAQDPEVILMDEPTSHLDLSNQSTIIQVMSDLVSRGKTVVFTTHDPNIAATTADHILLMTRGQIHTFGETQQVLTEANLSAIYRTTIRVETIGGQLVVYMPKETA
ncbi:MAG: ABC transporter ATP-binding protein [Anaerolineales bacterium]|nr:ABC transporter ATP-binding protein [Anaerolineales bacterium]